MKLYIIRHGETSWNAEGRLQGQTDIPLNENGIRLAKITGEALKEVPFDLAISSPLKRARQTADLVLAGRQVPVLEDARIEELSFGSWKRLLAAAKQILRSRQSIFRTFIRIRFIFRRQQTEKRSHSSVPRISGAFWDELVSNPDWKR